MEGDSYIDRLKIHRGQPLASSSLAPGTSNTNEKPTLSVCGGVGFLFLMQICPCPVPKKFSMTKNALLVTDSAVMHQPVCVGKGVLWPA